MDLMERVLNCLMVTLMIYLRDGSFDSRARLSADQGPNAQGRVKVVLEFIYETQD